MVLKRVFILFLVVCNCGPVSSEENLALHKSYTLSPKPNYKLCTDDLDGVQLTDGRTYGSWWGGKDTVGWRSASTGIEIVIDLAQPVPFDQVRVHSVGGGFANVEFAEFIAVLVSDDGKTYGFAGLISSEDLANLRSVGYNRIPHTFIIDNLNTQGRFVKVVVRPYGDYFFLDEVEVIHSPRRSEATIGRRKNLLQFSDSGKLLGAIEDYLQLRADIGEAIKELQNNRNRFSTDFFEKVSSELESMSEECKLPTERIYSQNELLALSKKLGTLRAQIYGELYKSELVCFVANPMEILFEKDIQFVDAAKRQQIDIQLWQQECESAAVNIVSCSQEPLDVVVSVSPLVSQSGTRVDGNKTVAVRRAIFVKALRVGLVADALVLQPKETFELQPGSITQIWLTVFNPALAAGDYRGTFAVVASSKLKKLPVKTIELNLKVENITFPRNVALNTCAWDYFTPVSSVTKDIIPIVSEDLRAHYINISVIHNSIVPFPKNMSQYDRLPKGMDFSKFDRQMQANNFARIYLLDFNFMPDRKDRGRFGEWMSPNWKSAFSAWLKILVDHLHKTGIDYERFALYPFDESLCDEFYEMAKLIKETDPKIKIYANNFGRGPRDFMRFRDLIDIWCPHWIHCKEHPEWLATIKGFSKEVWTYGGEAKAPAKSYPPYGYYRLMAWDAFDRGQTGVGFYTYIDRLGHAWDDTLMTDGYYGVIYGAADSPVDVDTHGEKIIPSRRWEAWREGIEDYEYLLQLQKTIKEVRTSNPQAAADAEATLNLQVKRVVNNRTDCEIVYSARQIITKTIQQLRQLNR